MDSKRNIIIYRDHLLYPSETFIKSQGEGLESFRAYYAGSRKVDGLALPQERAFVRNSGAFTGWLKEALFKITGIDLNLLNRLRTLDPLLIHAHFGPDGVLALPLALQLHVPLIVTFHGFDATVKDEYARKSFFGHRLYVRKRHTLQHQAALFLAASDFIKSKMIEQGYPGERIIVHYIGIDIGRFRPGPRENREPIVLFVGRLVENKGCEYLIRAMSKVQQVFPESELVIIGDGPLRAHLEKLAVQTLHRHCFLGVQSQEAVCLWMKRAKVFSVPSITVDSGASEGFGMVFAEANASGLPVVSFATGGIPEAVAHGETGFLTPEKDWEGLAFYIQRLFDDDLLWNKLSSRAQERVRKLFDLKKQTHQLENYYKNIAGYQKQSAAGQPGHAPRDNMERG